jgi:hypothetical protein
MVSGSDRRDMIPQEARAFIAARQAEPRSLTDAEHRSTFPGRAFAGRRERSGLG